MKNLFVCFLLLTSLSSYSQFTTPEKVDAIDLKLDKFRKRHNTGTVLQIVGGLVYFAGYITREFDGSDAVWQKMYIAGSGFLLAGTLTKMTSYSFLRPTQSPVNPN